MPRRQVARQAARFVKHVVPATIKPVHSLWHEIIGFIFLGVAAVLGFNVVRHSAILGPFKLALIVPLIVITAWFGISSFLKARRISRS